MMKKTIIIIMCLVLGFSLFSNNIKSYGKKRIVKYKDFQARKYVKETIQMITLSNVNHYIVNNKILRKNNVMYGFNIYGLYFCFESERHINLLFNPDIVDGVFVSTLFHNVGSEISEMMEPVLIKKEKNKLVFYTNHNKYIFDIIF
jgi:hypothetical protein